MPRVKFLAIIPTLNQSVFLAKLARNILFYFVFAVMVTPKERRLYCGLPPYFFTTPKGQHVAPAVQKPFKNADSISSDGTILFKQKPVQGRKLPIIITLTVLTAFF